MTGPETPDPVCLKISGVLRHLALARGETVEDVGQAVGLHRVAMYRRLSGEVQWRVAEVAAVARHLNVPVQVLYDGPERLLNLPERRSRDENPRDGDTSPRRHPEAWGRVRVPVGATCGPAFSGSA